QAGRGQVVMPGRGQGVVIERRASAAGGGNLVGRWQEWIRGAHQAGLEGIVKGCKGLASEPVLVTSGAHASESWGQELDQRTVVGIERCGGKEVSDRRQVPSVEHEETPGCDKERIVAPRGEIEEALAQARDVNGPWSELTHQSDDRAVRVEIAAPEARLGENAEERAHDNVELYTRELVERQPLAEHPARRQVPRYGVIHLARIEVPRAGMPRNKQVGHDDIKTVAAGGEVAAAIVEHEVHVRPCQQLPVP